MAGKVTRVPACVYKGGRYHPSRVTRFRNKGSESCLGVLFPITARESYTFFLSNLIAISRLLLIISLHLFRSEPRAVPPLSRFKPGANK